MKAKRSMSLEPPDQAAREAIVRERERNVTVIAGAGTGKTKTIIDRAIDLLAPADGHAPVPIRRLAAITFTRRAAGELRFRLRERLLAELERAPQDQRALRLGEALSNLDAAFIGTIHGFADRLLRLRPVEAQLSPAYALVEDNSELVRETFLRLRRGAEAGTLDGELGEQAVRIGSDLVAEAADTLRAAARAGVQMERRENAFGSVDSVEAVLASMVDTRDVYFPLPPLADPGLAEARAAAARLHDMQRRMRGQAIGHQRLRRKIRILQRLAETEDAAEAFRIVADAQRGRRLYMRDFGDDSLGWSIYKAMDRTRRDSLAEQLQGPHRWLAARLVRLFPVVAAMYERVKDEHEVVDYLDLLIKLRNLLRDDPEARRLYQGLFDHIFVDEFQDTDPLQCEIVFYLSERGASARTWSEVDLMPGKLTIVGDPKQSIYRFRRADIAMYGRAAERLSATGALVERLETNFRSRPELIEFFNRQLAAILGEEPDGAFHPESGRVNYEPLRASDMIAKGGRCVHLLPYADDEQSGLIAGTGRFIEGAAVAHYVRWLLTTGRVVRDPETNAERPVRPGDIAVLAPVTTHLRHLLEKLEELGVEYTARGGVLFLGHPIVRRFLLALRALADRDDGVAQAVLFQPPFLALDWADLAAGRSSSTEEFAGRRRRLTGAREVISTLRRNRHQRGVGATARDLIEQTALGRTVATGRNGRQLLAALYEVAAELDRRAGLEGLDFDAATELLRVWAEAPVYLDAPEPLGHDAIRVLTIHQAKGLEFPVVILWDGFQTFNEPGNAVWRVDRDGRAWALRLGPIAVEYPPTCGLLQRERTFGEQERRRLYYVASTRARDLLVLPLPVAKSERMTYATRAIAADVDDSLVERLPMFTLGALPQWAGLAIGDPPANLAGDVELQERLDAATARLSAAIGRATEPQAVPTAVTTEAEGASAPTGGSDADEERAGKVVGARYGPTFGIVVHRAIELILSGGARSSGDAVRVAAAEVPTREHLKAAAADVDRAFAVLRQQGIGTEQGWTLRTEYPLCAAMPGGKLMSGIIDLLAVRGHEIAVIDFKTDAARSGTVAEAYPSYATQLRLYAEILRRSGWGPNHTLRSGLLLTAVGELRWLEGREGS